MADFKLVISDPKTGKSYQRETKDNKNLLGLKIGDTVKGEVVDLTGYEFELTGGSDNTGFPMRKDVAGSARKHVLIVRGFGLKKARKGGRFRRTVAGNTVGHGTAQINLKITKQGTAKLESAPKEGEAPAEDAPKEAPKEIGSKASKSTEQSSEEEKKEAPKEAPKEEPKK